MARTKPADDVKQCSYCSNPGSTYSIACLGCVRRLWKNTLPANRPGILSMVEAFGSADIAERMRLGMTTKGKQIGKETTGRSDKS